MAEEKKEYETVKIRNARVKYAKVIRPGKAYDESQPDEWSVNIYPTDEDRDTLMAHGANPKLVGKDMIDIQDVDGKYFVKERVEWARSKSSFWQDYKFVNPTSKKIEAKQMYCERVSETAVCAGIYKR